MKRKLKANLLSVCVFNARVFQRLTISRCFWFPKGLSERQRGLRAFDVAQQGLGRDSQNPRSSTLEVPAYSEENFAVTGKISIFENITEKYAKDCRKFAGGRINHRDKANSLRKGGDSLVFYRTKLKRFQRC